MSVSALRDTDSRKSIRDQVSAEEWEARVELAAFYRIVERLGMTDAIYNHITVRVPGTHDQFLINAFGLDYSEATASSLVKIDINGEIILPSPTGYGINYAGYIIHSAVHAARHDVVCVAHTHTAAGVAVSSLDCGLLPLNQNALRFRRDLTYHDYEGPAFFEEEKTRLVADLGDKNNMILRNHGLLSCGRSVGEAYINLWALETACRMQVQTMSCNQPLRMPSDEALAAFDKVCEAMMTSNQASGALEWDAARRMLDKVTTEYMQ